MLPELRSEVEVTDGGREFLLSTTTLTSRERFEATCAHRSADRLPIDYLAHPALDRRLRERLGVGSEAELLDALGCDLFYLPGRDLSQNEGYLSYYRGPALSMNETERVCPLGIRWRRGVYRSKFAVDEAIEGPFGPGATTRDIRQHPWPKPSDFDFGPLLEACRSQQHRVIVGGLWTGILGDSCRLYGFERFLTDMVEQPAVVHALVDRLTEMYLELNATIFSLLRGKLDVWFFGNDFGHQGGLLMSRSMWAAFFFENIKRLTTLAHEYKLRVMMHSCGAVSELIPALVEAGVDILDPVQVTATGMDPASLKAAYGRKIVLHGAIDTQHILPRVSPDQAARHATDTIDILGRDGGYIFAPSQILQADIPVENVVAVYHAARRRDGAR